MVEKTKYRSYPADEWIILSQEQTAKLSRWIPNWFLVDVVGAVIMWIPLLIARDMLNSGYSYRLEATHDTMLFLTLEGLALGLIGAGLQILAILAMKGRVKRRYCKILVMMWGLIGAFHYAGFMMPTPHGIDFWYGTVTPGVPYSRFWLFFQNYVIFTLPMIAVFGTALITTLVIRIRSASANNFT